jgi:hypothetical protein
MCRILQFSARTFYSGKTRPASAWSLAGEEVDRHIPAINFGPVTWRRCWGVILSVRSLVPTTVPEGLGIRRIVTVSDWRLLVLHRVSRASCRRWFAAVAMGAVSRRIPNVPSPAGEFLWHNDRSVGKSAFRRIRLSHGTNDIASQGPAHLAG